MISGKILSKYRILCQALVTRISFFCNVAESKLAFAVTAYDKSLEDYKHMCFISTNYYILHVPKDKLTKTLRSLKKARFQDDFNDEKSADHTLTSSSTSLPSVIHHTESYVNVERDTVVNSMAEAYGFCYYSITDLYKKHLPLFLRLGKHRLTLLVLSTTLVGYLVGTSGMNVFTLSFCMLGTGLTSVAANSVNQFLEVPYDSQMNRTKSRPLVLGKLTTYQAGIFSLLCFGGGTAILFICVNTITALLGVLNFLLYTMVYTPMKRISHWNTWIGSIVGAIPPLMGFCANSGTIVSSGLFLPALLYAWQFPHFMSLSWNLRADYSRAGYQMTSVRYPDLCKLVALRYSAVIIPISLTAPWLRLTSWTFAFDSFPINLALLYFSWRFYQVGDSESSRNLFRCSLFHLPAILCLLLISKY